MLNIKAMISAIFFVIFLTAIVTYFLWDEIRQSASSKHISMGVITAKKSNSFSGVGSSPNRLSQTRYYVEALISGNHRKVSTGNERIYNKAKKGGKVAILWREYDHEILDIASDRKNLNLYAEDDLSFLHILLMGGGTVLAIVVMFVFGAKKQSK